MKRVVAAVALAACLYPAVVRSADRTPERAAAEELLLLLGMDRNVDSMMQAVMKSVPSTMKMEGVPEEAAAAGRAATEKMFALIRREMAWEKMKDRYVDVYAEVFTLEELKGLSDFYRTPLGRRFVEKTPLVMEKSMAIGQETTKRILPEMMKLIEEEMGKGRKGAKGR